MTPTRVTEDEDRLAQAGGHPALKEEGNWSRGGSYQYLCTAVDTGEWQPPLSSTWEW